MCTREQFLKLIDWYRSGVDAVVHGPHEKDLTFIDAILRVILSSRFRKGLLTAKSRELYCNMYAHRIEKRVKEKLPIQLTLLGAPFKNLNPVKNTGRILPDLAEVAFLLNMYRLHRSLKTFYEPGIELILIHDGIYYADACNIPTKNAIAYKEYFRDMLASFPFFSFVKPYELTELVRKTGIDEEEYLSRASRIAHVWLTSKAAAGEVKAAYKRAIFSLCPDEGMRERYLRALQEYRTGNSVTDKEIHALILKSVESYKAKQVLIYELKDPREEFFPDAVHATSSSHTGKIPLWLTRRGRALLPWHGIGVIYRDTSLGVEYEEFLHHAKEFKPVHLEREQSPFFYIESPATVEAILSVAATERSF
jgi:hypothetical protein